MSLIVPLPFWLKECNLHRHPTGELIVTLLREVTMSTDSFIHPVIKVPGPGGEDSIYKMARLDDTLMSNYLRTVKYGSYIYSVIMSMMVAGRQDPSGK